MVYNLKAGLMATTTMVESPVAFTKQTNVRIVAESWGGNQNQGEWEKYKDTFQHVILLSRTYLGNVKKSQQLLNLIFWMGEDILLHINYV